MAEATAAVAAPLPVELLQIVYRTGRKGDEQQQQQQRSRKHILFTITSTINKLQV